MAGGVDDAHGTVPGRPWSARQAARGAMPSPAARRARAPQSTRTQRSCPGSSSSGARVAASTRSGRRSSVHWPWARLSLLDRHA